MSTPDEKWNLLLMKNPGHASGSNILVTVITMKNDK